MNTRTRTSRALRATLPIMIAALATMAFASPASAAPTSDGAVSATYAGAGVGYNKVLGGHAAGTIDLSVEGATSVSAFCIEYGVDLETSAAYTSKSWSASGVANLGKAAYIATQHNTMGVKLDDPRSENAAAQLAIWHYTDSTDFTSVDNAYIRNRASELMTLAKTQPEGASSFNVALSQSSAGTGEDATNTVVATVTSVGGAPVANQAVTFTFGAHTATVSTDASGIAKDTLKAPATAGEMTVTSQATIAAGTVFAPAGKQMMLTTSAASVTRTVPITLAAAPTPPPAATTTAPVTTVAPVTEVIPAKPVVTKPVVTKPAVTKVAPVKTTPKAPAKVTKTTPSETKAAAVPAKTGPPTQLPYTGGWVQPWMFLVAAAGVLIGLIARKRIAASRTH